MTKTSADLTPAADPSPAGARAADTPSPGATGAPDRTAPSGTGSAQPAGPEADASTGPDQTGAPAATSRLRVAVLGAGGRMGRAAVAAVEAADDLDLVAAVGRGDDLGDLGGADVAVELSVPDAAPEHVAHCIDRGIHVVVGTTGWDDARLADLRERLARRPEVGVLIAPNFSVGALLMMSFARQAARFYESVEIVELHHPDKVDAPSGTAARTARIVGEARAEAGLGPVPDATAQDPHGARGAVVDGVHVHAVRQRGLIAHQEVLFGAPGEGLTIRHDSYDRESFMPGVLAGVRAVGGLPGLTVGLEGVLGID